MRDQKNTTGSVSALQRPISGVAKVHLQKSLSIEGRGWGIDLILGIASIYYGDMMILIAASILRGGIALYFDYLKCLSHLEWLQHEAIRSTVLGFGLLFALPFVVQGYTSMGVVIGIVGAAVSAVVGFSNGWFSIKEVNECATVLSRSQPSRRAPCRTRACSLNGCDLLILSSE